MKDENAHFTPQQISKLLNLHIKSHKCLDVKCQTERQQLLNTIEKLARNFYDIYKMFEKQKREMSRITNLYKDFCIQFGLPVKIDLVKQPEISQIDKVANMIYQHFIKIREVNKKSKVHPNFDENLQSSGLTSINGQCKKDFSGLSNRKKSGSSSSSIVAIDNENSAQKNGCETSLRETDNGKRSFNSILVNNGSIPATNSSLSPPEGTVTKNKRICAGNHCSNTPKTVTSNFLGHRKQMGNCVIGNASVNTGDAGPIYERGLKRHISDDNVNEFGAPNKMRVTKQHLNGTSFATSIGPNIFPTKCTNHSPNVIPFNPLHTSDNSTNKCLTELTTKDNLQCDFIQQPNNGETPICQNFFPSVNRTNMIGGTVLITEGRELSIGQFSSPEMIKEREIRRNDDIVIQLDDDD
ncbi:hypothetical protein niasHS_003616 [Heterodera schachtii]|uniref:Uncharacterized protein n=1 Tax=Heterodera schachtii TaxID=97005 RepID=A0ABD2KHC5_HETSC